ncbi:hypothetical protein AnigIFM59636_002408 [Aspergillus niger]|nr:hypothetical protein AnigIFM59636_002408 [Aspergillus niger]
MAALAYDTWDQGSESRWQAVGAGALCIKLSAVAISHAVLIQQCWGAEWPTCPPIDTSGRRSTYTSGCLMRDFARASNSSPSMSLAGKMRPPASAARTVAEAVQDMLQPRTGLDIRLFEFDHEPGHVWEAPCRDNSATTNPAQSHHRQWVASRIMEGRSSNAVNSNMPCDMRYLSLRATNPTCGSGILRYGSTSLSSPMSGRSTLIVTGHEISGPFVDGQFDQSRVPPRCSICISGTSGAPPQQITRAE